MHRVYGAVSAGRDAPYLASDVPPVWKHGYVPLLPPSRPLHPPCALCSTPCPGISVWSNPPTRPRPYQSSISLASTSSCRDLNLLILLARPANPISPPPLPFPAFDDHLFGPADAALPANLPSVEFIKDKGGEKVRNGRLVPIPRDVFSLLDLLCRRYVIRYVGHYVYSFHIAHEYARDFACTREKGAGRRLVA